MFEIRIVEETLNQDLVKTVNARDLHAGLGVGGNFSTWIRRRIKKYGFVQGVDFTMLSNLGNQVHGGSNRIDYHLTIDMAKELSMVEKTAKGKEARQYFIKVEKKALAKVSQVSPSDQVLLAQIELEKLKLTEKTKQLAIEAKIKLGKKKTGIRRLSDCPHNFVTMKVLVRELEDYNTPIAVSALTEFVTYYARGIDKRANCIHKEQFYNVLRNIIDFCEKDGAFWLDKESGIKFKAEWIV